MRTDRAEVALTFDDGPLAGSTEAVLGQLQAHGAHATFFVIGEAAERYPDLVRRLSAAGEDVESHGERHIDMGRLSAALLRRSMTRSADTVERLTGTRPTLLRPPYGSFSRATRYAAAAAGMRLVLWSVDTRDWSNPGVDAIVDTATRSLAPGAIILFHDGGSPRHQTVAALDRLWTALEARGLKAVTVPELLSHGTALGAGAATPS